MDLLRIGRGGAKALAALALLAPLAAADAQQAPRQGQAQGQGSGQPARPSQPAQAQSAQPAQAPAAPADQPAQVAPHAWLFGSWTGGLYPPVDTEGPACFAQPTLVFTRDVIMRVSLLDVTYRQRLLETVSGGPDAVEFRLAPAAASVPALGGRLPPDSAFGCENPNNLRVERRGPDEIVLPNCAEFPGPLRRCTTPR